MPTKSPPATSAKEASAIYRIVGHSPAFPGREAAMTRWLSENLRMHEAVECALVSGEVKLSFIANTDGPRQGIEVVKVLTSECNKKALRLVRTMPNWKPDRTASRAVRVKQNDEYFSATSSAGIPNDLRQGLPATINLQFLVNVFQMLPGGFIRNK